METRMLVLGRRAIQSSAAFERRLGLRPRQWISGTADRRPPVLPSPRQNTLGRLDGEPDDRVVEATTANTRLKPTVALYDPGSDTWFVDLHGQVSAVPAVAVHSAMLDRRAS
jgi:hypothetical protein